MIANNVIINVIIIIIITVLGISMKSMNGLTTGMKNTECSVARFMPVEYSDSMFSSASAYRTTGTETLKLG